MPEQLKKPSDCNKRELSDFYKMVLEGEQVPARGLVDRIEKAEMLAFHQEEGLLVGIAALKRPIQNYKKRIFAEAGVENESEKYKFEVGWVYTKPKYRRRGIAGRLVQLIVETYDSESMFATTLMDNSSMRKILERNQFRELGRQYQDKTGKYDLQLFARKL